MHRIFVVAGLSIFLLAAGCGQQTAPEDATAMPDQGLVAQHDPGTLPSPSTLTRGVSAWYCPFNASERVRLGLDESLDLSSRCEKGPSSDLERIQDFYRLKFLPLRSPFYPLAHNVSYRGYRLKPAAGSAELDIHLEWADQTPAKENLYVALADFATDSWHWLEMENVSDVSFPNKPQMRNAKGEIFVLVVVPYDPAMLSWIRVGGDAPPFVGFILEYWEGPRGPFRIDCSLDCFDVDGEIARYEFDLDGDGTYETNNGAEPMILAELLEPVPHLIGVKVTDSSGQSAAASRYVFVNDWHAEDLGQRELVGFAMDSLDRLHLCLAYGGGYYYWLGDQTSWQQQQLPSDLIGEMDCVAMTLDRQERPAILCVGESQSRVIRLAHASWEAATSSDLQMEAVPYPKYALKMDGAGFPHVAVGSDIPWEFDLGDNIYPVRYWAYDGADWILRFTRDDCGHFYGFALDECDAPCLAYAGTIGENTAVQSVYAYAGPAGLDWSYESIAEYRFGSTGFVLESSEKAYVCPESDRDVFSRIGGSWTQITGEISPIGGLSIDPLGRLNFVGISYLSTEHTVLADGTFQRDTMLGDGRASFVAPLVEVSSNGEVHVVTESGLFDNRYGYTGKEPLQHRRLMHYWK